MMRPSELGTSTLPDFTCALDAAGADAAACTSEARISPPGPEARTVARSTPNSLASRRALGEILALGAATETELADCDAAAGTTLPGLYSNFETACFIGTLPPTQLGAKIIPSADPRKRDADE